MDIRPILSPCSPKTAAALIVLEVACPCAHLQCVVPDSNRWSDAAPPEWRMRKSSGSISPLGKTGSDALVKQDVAALRGLPGVKAATS